MKTFYMKNFQIYTLHDLFDCLGWEKYPRIGEVYKSCVYI